MARIAEQTDAELVALATKLGYQEAQVKGEAGVAALYRYMFTWAILSGIERWGYEGRWCYASYAQARAAFDAWDGTGEPTGWHRHPASGRRVDEQGNMYVER